MKASVYKKKKANSPAVNALCKHQQGQKHQESRGDEAQGLAFSAVLWLCGGLG